MKSIAKHFVPNPGTLLILGLFLLAQSVAGSPSAPFLSQAPSATLISYQGRLADAGGNPLTGDYQMQFALYSVPAGGSACWSETQTLSVSDGLFNVLLGSVSAIDPSCLAGDVYLGIKVGSDSEMTPRELLTSVAHAVQALTVPDGSITSAKLNLVDGNVGIGTTNPGPKLEVVADGHGVKSTTSAPNAWAGLFYNSNNGAEALLAGPSGIAARFLNGNVGIGTADPKSTLDVAGTLSVNDRINLIRNGYWAEIETDSAGGGSSNATRLYFYGYDASENRNQIAVFDGNSNVTFYGSVNAHGEVYTSRLNSPQDTDLMIDAGYQSHNNLSLNDDVSIPNGNLDMVDHQIKKVSQISSSGDLTIDAGDGPRRTLTLQDDVRLPDGNLTVEGDGTSKIEGSLQVGNNSASPSFAGMDGNDMYVDGQFEQAGSGGARLYKVGVGRDPESGAGTLAVANDIVAGGWIKSPGGTDLWIDAGAGTHGTLSLHDDVRIASGNLNMEGNSILNCGALVEANLQTSEDLAAKQVDRFEEGDVLCWSDDQLEKCSTSGDPAVQAVANKNGRPIVIGAEVIKVLGPVKKNGFLVASSVPGYAVANDNPALGTVIAQALENFDGEKGTIKAMIRKF